MIVLCWDIDGTLLTTGRAGILAWEEAVFDVLGEKVDLSGMNTSGLTDVEIAQKLVEEYGRGLSMGVRERVLRRYEELLSARLPLRKGKVLPGVREVLEWLRGRPDVVSILLTGNTRAGARAKLSHYGLDSHFTLGAFADDEPGGRPSIARRAQALAWHLAGGDIRPERVYVIGDTPHDIRCGKAIGARTVAVASGTYSLEELLEHGPWWAIERLPEPQIFAQKLGIPV